MQEGPQHSVPPESGDVGGFGGLSTGAPDVIIRPFRFVTDKRVLRMLWELFRETWIRTGRSGAPDQTRRG